MRIRGFVVAAMGLLFAGPAFGGELTLTANRILRVDFQINGPFSQAPDVFFLGFGPDAPIANAIGTRHASLYHGSQLLGENTASFGGDIIGPIGLHPAGAWRSADSLFTFGSPATVDFGTLFAGSEVGHIDFSIESGDLRFDSEDIQLYHFIATGFAGGFGVAPFPTITSIRIVPEPSIVANVAIALLVTFGIVRRRIAQGCPTTDRNGQFRRFANPANKSLQSGRRIMPTACCTSHSALLAWQHSLPAGNAGGLVFFFRNVYTACNQYQDWLTR
jgi:hypothetical protein